MTCIKTLSEHTAWIRVVNFNKDGSLFASGSDDNTVKLWNSETFECLMTLSGHTS